MDLALRDDLTGAWNRRYLRRLLDEDWAELVATQGTITLLVLDLDFFKEINDAHGHLAGDDVLHRASDRLRQSFRAEDRLIRYGGDEFVVVLFGAGAEEARVLAERARSALSTVEITSPESGGQLVLPLSFSMGVASFPVDGATGEEVLAVADRRLYEEKRSRRAPAAAADRGRRRLLLASGLAVAVLAIAGWVEWRRLRAAPPPPPAVLAPASSETVPLAEIVVRDEEELVRLRDEVRRLQAELAGARPADDRGLYEARIRELEARLTEAGDPRPVAGSAGLDAAGSAEMEGTAENGTGMQIGERRTREGLDLQLPAGAVPAPGAPPGGAAGVAGASGATGATGAERRRGRHRRRSRPAADRTAAAPAGDPARLSAGRARPSPDGDGRAQGAGGCDRPGAFGRAGRTSGRLRLRRIGARGRAVGPVPSRAARRCGGRNGDAPGDSLPARRSAALSAA